jgi:hypothetical protein
MQQRLDILLKLEEERENSKRNLMQHQEVIQKWFDKSSVGKKEFHEGDLVLTWDKENDLKGKHTKFQKLWFDPYLIHPKNWAQDVQTQNIGGRRGGAPCQWSNPQTTLLLITHGNIVLYIVGFPLLFESF